jgi:hypothetical protein
MGRGRTVTPLDNPPASRYRRRLPGARPVRVNVCLSDSEYRTVADAAHAAGLTPTGFVAEAVLATARGDASPPADERRQVVLELMQARAHLRRYGNNINQAARVLNAGGQLPEWLAHAVALTNRVVGDIDEAVQALFDQPRGR